VNRSRLISAMAVGVAVLVGCSQGATNSSATVGLVTLSNEATSIEASIGDRPVLVSLWAVWCQPCRRELPELQRIHDSGAAVDVLAVNVGDDPERITSYLDEMDLALPVVVDPVGDLLTALDIGTVPATILFGADGSILWSHLGAVTTDQVNQALATFVVPSKG
jgi:cytochrome c biogenesis protein CcmG/thiol:disulfide interchange protein DsbE